MLSAIVGINWGDEGKGRIVDLLSENYDIVCRYQGGNNAGHTVINERGKFILNLLPSGILRETTVNVMGNGMVIDLEHLTGEIERVREKGIKITPDNLKISDKAIICLPYHKFMDIIEEDRLGDKKFGSTRRGIGPVYADKYMKKDIRMEDLFDEASLREKIYDLVEWKNITVKGYGKDAVNPDDILAWLDKFGSVIKPYVTDVSKYLYKACDENKNIMFEAQLGALRDIEFGIYPYTSSSTTLSAYAPIGAGIPGKQIDCSLGIMKAYSTCVGEGPFTCEMFGEEAEELRRAGGEYGAATGRPRRVGPFDVVASKYGVLVQGATEIALTKLDVLSYLDKIPVCTAYDIDGEITTDFPSGVRLKKAKPIVEYFDGFGEVSHCRTYGELPENAKKYIKYIEEAVNCKIKYISVGAERDEYIEIK
ncbi:MAG: adenylosuccinate synthase [Clostridia bacterium]|nr:adenylosuccinate synthase [Clostridia bacterium]